MDADLTPAASSTLAMTPAKPAPTVPAANGPTDADCAGLTVAEAMATGNPALVRAVRAHQERRGG